MAELPTYKPTRFYKWQQKNPKDARDRLLWTGWWMVITAIVEFAIDIPFGSTGKGNSHIGSYVGMAFLVAGIPVLLAAYNLAMLVAAHENRHRADFSKRLSAATQEERNRLYLVSQAEHVDENGVPCLKLIVHRTDDLRANAVETVTIPVSGAGWMEGGGEKPWCMFPASEYVIGEDGVVRMNDNRGNQAVILSPVNELDLAPWSHVLTASARLELDNLIEGL